MKDLLASNIGELVPVATLSALGVCVFSWFIPWMMKRSTKANPTASANALRSRLTDTSYLLLSPVTELCTRMITTIGFVVCAGLIGRPIDLDLLHGYGPVVDQPRWLILVEMLVLADFAYYWVHRMAHNIPWLWRLHAVHHSTQHLCSLSALRAHPGEVYTVFLSRLPLFLLGFPLEALVDLMFFTVPYALWIHSDVRYSARPLHYLFNSPDFHRWHHALEFKGNGTNFAGLFPIFDALFGTYHFPAAAPAALGIADRMMPESLLGQLVYPFRSHKLIRPIGVSAHPDAASTRGGNIAVATTRSNTLNNLTAETIATR